MARPVNVVASAVVLVLLLSAGVAVVDTIQAGQSGLDSDVTRQAALLGADGAFVALDDGKGTAETVYKTTGYAVNLTGADDSYYRTQSDVTLAEDQTWTVSIWASVAPGNGSENMTAVSVDGRVIISYNGSASEWQGWYYDEGGRNSYEVSVATAGNEAGNLTNIMLLANGTDLAIYRNNTRGDVADITTSNITDAPVNDTNWAGRQEELRVADDALNDTVRQELVDTPVEQQPDINTTARAMFDQPGEGTQLLLYTGTSLTQSNVTFASGFAEQVMGGSDYTWSTDGPLIAPTAGGALSGAPVAYVSYNFDTALANVIGAWSDLTSLAAVIPLIAIAVLVYLRAERLG